MHTIVFATNNEHKLREVREILGEGFRLVTLRECGITEDIPENEPTIEGNALQKARYVHSRTGLDCFADDTGLEVASLGGAPGVRSARYAADTSGSAADSRNNTGADSHAPAHYEYRAAAGPHEADVKRGGTSPGSHDFDANTALLLRNLEGRESRAARFRTVIALIKDGREYTFEGIINGRITDTAAGGEGFGYDPVFMPDGYTQTFAQMPPELKNTISHRARAVRKLAEFLKSPKTKA